MKLSILIAEPRDILRKGLRAMLHTDENAVNIYEAITLAEMQSYLETNMIDMIVINQSLINNSVSLPRGRFVILASKLDMSLFCTARELGARGYLLENTSAELLRTTLFLKEGAFLIEPTLATEIIDNLTRNARYPVQEELLTPREREIVELLRQGINRSAIAEQLCISMATLKTHIKNISRKRERSVEASD